MKNDIAKALNVLTKEVRKLNEFLKNKNSKRDRVALEHQKRIAGN